MQDNPTVNPTKKIRSYDLTGQVFGRLTVLYVGKRKRERHRYWVCRCECGTEKEILQPLLVN